MEIQYTNQPGKFTRRPLYFHLPLRNISVEFSWTTNVIINNRKNKTLTLVGFGTDVRGRQTSHPARLRFIRHIVVPSCEFVQCVRTTKHDAIVNPSFILLFSPTACESRLSLSFACLAASKRINTIHSVQDVRSQRDSMVIC